MSKARGKAAGRSVEEWEKLSAELDKEMAGAPENTEPLSAEELSWYQAAVMGGSPNADRKKRGRDAPPTDRAT